MSLKLTLESITKDEVFDFSITSCICFDHETCIILKKSSASLYFINIYSNFDEKELPLKIVQINNPPCDVSGILLNSKKQCVLLIGECDVSIILFDKSLAFNKIKNSSKSHTSCTVVDNELFLAVDRVKVIDVKWLTWKAFNIFVILYSDNKLRFYNAKQVGRPLAVVDLNYESSGCDRPINCNISAALNECAIGVEPSYTLSTADTVTLWVLLGSGEVLLVSLSGCQLEKQSVSSPLVMLPSREDNFGQDYCAFLVLPGDPELLVLCSKTGDLFHFLPFYDNVLHSWKLHLFDQIQLELLMAAFDAKQDSTEENFSTTIRLTKDSYSATRYFCIHGAGMHAVIVPWHIDVQRFLHAKMSENDKDDNSAWSVVSNTPPSRVNHLICTHSIDEENVVKLSTSLPVGWAVMPGQHRGGTKLLLMLASADNDAKFLSVEMRAARSLAPMLFEAQNSDDAAAHDGTTSEENFETRIKRLLTREASQPLLYSGSEKQITDESAFRLVTTCTERLRVEHLARLSRVREELSRRVVMLSHRAQLLKNELLEAEQSSAHTGAAVQTLLKRAVELDERNHQLGERFEIVNRRVASQHYTSLSPAEIDALNKLRSMARTLLERKERLNRLKSRVKYLHENSINSSIIVPPFPSEFSCQQSSRLRMTLKKDSERLSKLVIRTKNLLQ